jgi:hypothetical protein
MLETNESILVINSNFPNTDSMEFSLLRFLQLLLYDPKQITTDGFSYYPVNIKCNEDLHYHMKEYPKIFNDIKYFLTEGKIELSDWTLLLGGLPCFEYFSNDKCELFTNIENIYHFFNSFLYMNLDIRAGDQNLEIISKKFSTINKKIRCSLKQRTITREKMSRKEIVDLQYNNDNEYQNDSNDKYDVIQRDTVILICINDIKYEWNLFETYFDKDSHRYIKGHSLIVKLGLN